VFGSIASTNVGRYCKYSAATQEFHCSGDGNTVTQHSNGMNFLGQRDNFDSLYFILNRLIHYGL
jgi:hypothetical protein